MAPVTPCTDEILLVANSYNLPLDLLTAQVMVESSGRADAFRYEERFYRRYIQSNPKAEGYRFGPLAACSYGLMQVVLQVALEMGYTDRPEVLFEPRIGLTWGAKKMRALMNWAGNGPTDYVQALCAYNGGTVGNLHPPYRNQTYADKVYRLAGRAVDGGSRTA